MSLTKLEAMNSILTNEIDVAQGTVDDFRTAIADALLDGAGQVANSAKIAHETKWRTEDVLRASAVLQVLIGIKRYLDGDDGVTKKFEVMTHELEQHIDHLTGGQWGCTEPWRANSTSALSNLGNIADCSARQVAIKVLKPIVAELKSQAILDPNQDKG